MTQEQHTDVVDTTDESDESSVLNAVRKELRDVQKELKARPDRDSMRAELETELADDNAIEALLTGFGHPKGILDTVKGKLGDAERTKETVGKALQDIGYKVEITDVSSESEQDSQESTENTELATVTGLSARVQSAVQGDTTADVKTQLGEAETDDQVKAIMAEAGLLAEE